MTFRAVDMAHNQVINTKSAKSTDVARTTLESKEMKILDAELLSELTDRLLSYTNANDILLNRESSSQAVKHLLLMLEKNKQINLTAIRDPDDALVLHTYDSLLFLKSTSQVIDTQSNFKLLDMGTGGGFPGIPLACTSEGRITLLDSVGKKVGACSEFIQQLELTSRVLTQHARLEDFAVKKTERGSYDIVVARALAPLDILIEYATPFCKQGAYIILSKGTPGHDELARAKKVSNLCGVKLVSRETYELPDGYGHREIFSYKKIAPSKVKLPRKNGEARKNPLADL